MIDLNNIEFYREGNRLEAKKATGGLPESIWETYSAFANTLGGVILLGVEEHKDRSLHPVDLPDPEDLVEEFWRLVNDKNKVSANILSPDDVTVENINGKRIIVIRVPRALPDKMPVYIYNDPMMGFFNRQGDGDIRCNIMEIQAMLAEYEENKDHH